jgi:diguanylate cyclase (GGDEF)-like protein
VKQHQHQEHLEFLYESLKETQGTTELGALLEELLGAAGHVTRADYVEFVLFPGEGEAATRAVRDKDGELRFGPDALGPIDQRAADLLPAAGGVVVLPTGRPASVFDEFLAARGLRDAMIAPLRAYGEPFGFLTVGDKTGDVGTFDAGSAALFETLASHAGVLVEYGRLKRTLADVTALKEQLRHQAYHDALTGLPNRTLFGRKAAEAMAQGRHLDRWTAAVLFIDLDDFKAINDTRGHKTGDELLVQVAERVRLSLRPGDLPARLGGDEFGVLLRPTTPDGAETVARRLVAAFDEPFVVGGRETYVRASLGVALASSAGDADELLQNADVAMYAAKAAGKRRIAHFEQRMHDAVRRRHTLALELDQAAERGEIKVVFQPILSLGDWRVIGCEALARWAHPDGRLVSPAEFIPVAEQVGLMGAIGETVLREACRAAREWKDADARNESVGVSVNLSPSQLAGAGLVDTVARILVETRMDSASLTLEVTETTAMRDVDVAIKRLSELRELGVQTALDDFGTGHSSLERLDVLPLTMLKIPKPFIDRLGDSRSRIVDAFVQLAHSLELRCVAEGIERPMQILKLIEFGCTLGQGFHFARPMSKDDAAAYLRQRADLAQRRALAAV